MYSIEEWPAREAELRNSDGECDRTRLVIKIRSDLHPLKKRETLLHEILHAVWNASGVDYVKPGEEGYVFLISTYMFQVLVDNPNVVAWLTSVGA